MHDKPIRIITPNNYHLHLDGSHASAELDEYVKRVRRFTNGDFCGHPEGYRHFEPAYHRIFKTDHKKEFDAVWSDVEEKARALGFTGYIEGEFIRTECHYEERPFDDTVPFPFQLSRRTLSGAPGEEFREAEVHLVMDRDKSDPRLYKKLLDAGLYGAYIPDGDRVEVVFTAQGFLQDIDPLVEALRVYVRHAGGAVQCMDMQEIAIRWAIIGTDHACLPEIVDRIEWTG